MDRKQTITFCKYSWNIHQTLSLDGLPGIGKTTFVKTTLRQIIAEKHDVPLERVHVITREVGVLEPADLLGCPIQYNGRTYMCPPDWLPICKEAAERLKRVCSAAGQEFDDLTVYDDYYILFLDERKRGGDQIHKSIMSLLLNHELFGNKLHDKCYVVCADNDGENMNIAELDLAQASRVACINYAPTNDEHLEFFKSASIVDKNGDNGLFVDEKQKQDEVDKIIYSYLVEHKDQICASKEEVNDACVSQRLVNLPRSWTRFGVAIAENRKNGGNLLDVHDEETQLYLSEVAAMFLGEESAAKFAASMRNDVIHIDYHELFNKLKSSEWEKIEALLKKVGAKSDKDEHGHRVTSVLMAFEASANTSSIGDITGESGKCVIKYLDMLYSLGGEEPVNAFWTKWQNDEPTKAMAWQSFSYKRIGIINRCAACNATFYNNWRNNLINQGKDPDSDEAIK